jgi:hypothetical protein
MVFLARRQPRPGLAPLVAWRSCMPSSQGGWCGCNGSGGVQVPSSTQSRNSEVGRHGHGGAGDSVRPGNSEDRGVTTPVMVGSPQGFHTIPTGGRQCSREVASTGEVMRGRPARSRPGGTPGASSRRPANSSSLYMRVTTRAMGSASQEGACSSGSRSDRDGRERGSVHEQRTAGDMGELGTSAPKGRGGSRDGLRASSVRLRRQAACVGRVSVLAIKLHNVGSTVPLRPGAMEPAQAARLVDSVGEAASRLGASARPGSWPSRGCPVSPCRRKRPPSKEVSARDNAGPHGLAAIRRQGWPPERRVARQHLHIGSGRSAV